MRVRFSVHPLAAAGIFVLCAVMTPAAAYGAVFAVTLHEAAHLIAGRAVGLSLCGVMLTPFGISFEMSAPRSYVEQIFVSAAGPFVNLATCALVLSGIFPANAALRELFLFSLLLSALNLLPIRSLDGGAVLGGICALLFGAEISERVVDVTGAASLALIWMTGVYIFFYSAENAALFAFAAFMFASVAFKSEKKRNIT